MQVQERSDRLAALFRQELDAEPDGVWAAPGRVNLIGEHTDYNDGFVLPTAIDREVVAAVRLRDDGVFRCRSLDLPSTVSTTAEGLGPGRASGWSAYVLGVVWALREAGLDVPGMDVLVTSDVPSGAGLSSSAALEAATCLALVDLVAGRAGTPGPLDRTAMATACRRAETDVVGAPVGIMDQMASLHGRAGSALLLDCRSLDLQHVRVPLAEQGLALLVLDTKVHHAHATGEYAERRRACEQASAALGVVALRDATEQAVEDTLTGELQRCARHVVTENTRVLRTVEALGSGDVAEVGRLFAASHASMRDDFRISCPELDLAVEAATGAGAVAARMTGGGFGGCVAALVPVDAQEQVAQAARQAFAAAGHRAPVVFPVTASDGARRVA